jgi:ankyrin repeat protein
MVFHSDKAESLGLRQDAFIHTFPLERWVRLYNVLAKTPFDRLSPEVSREYIFVIKNALNLIKSSFQGAPCLTTEDCIVTGERYRSRLGAAVANSYSDMAELLLERGADPNSLVSNSLRCLNVAVMQGSSHMVRVLLSHGADVQWSAPEVQDTQLCPLRLAAESGLNEIVEILLAHTDYATGWHIDMDFVLEAAIYRHDKAIMRLLHDKMSPEKRDIVRILHTTWRRSANENAHGALSIAIFQNLLSSSQFSGPCPTRPDSHALQELPSYP